MDGYKDDLVLKKICIWEKIGTHEKVRAAYCKCEVCELIVIVGHGTGIMRVNT